jgi:hypothetical protein
MNIIKSLQNRISDRLTETKSPCTCYKTEAKAEQVAAELSVQYGRMFDTTGRACRYVIVYIEQLDKWTPAFDFSELFGRSTSNGGYVGVASDKGFYTF